MDTDVKPPTQDANALLRDAVERWRRQMTTNQVFLTNHSVELVLHHLAEKLSEFLAAFPDDSVEAIRQAVSAAHQFAVKRARKDHANRKKRRREARETQIRSSPLAAALAEKKLI